MSGACLGIVLALCCQTPALKPNQVLDFSHWKLTLPLDEDGNGQADEITSARLQEGFTDAASFLVNEKDRAVVFRARCGAPTTKGSSYPRSELRELAPNGKNASWSTADDAIYRLELTISIKRLPTVKRHVVYAQIHDADNDLLMLRLEGRKLMVERGGMPDLVLDDQYELGTPFELRIEAGQGHVKVFQNGRKALDWKVSRKGCYFKAGCYTQSNVDRGDAPDDFAEVQISKLVVATSPANQGSAFIDLPAANQAGHLPKQGTPP